MLDPVRSGKELVGKGSGTVRRILGPVRARLATVRFGTILKRKILELNLLKSQIFGKK